MHEDVRQKILAQREALIEKFGWMVQGVFEDVEKNIPGFSYSIGLHDKGFSELIVLGLPPDVAQTLLNDIAADAMMRRAASLPFLGEYRHANWPMAMYILDADAAKARSFAFGADNRSDGAATYLQVVWPDPKGFFPWQPGFDAKYQQIQPLLGVAPSVN